MIKLSTVVRAEITPGFKESFVRTNEQLLDKLRLDIENAPDYAKRRVEEAKKPQLARLYRLVHDEATRDMAYTTLRSLDFSKLDVHTHGETDFLWATTKPIVTNVDGFGKYDLGVYWIFVPQDDIVSGSLNRIHFIPERDKTTALRHMHHLVRDYIYRNGEYVDQDIRKHPLEQIPSTCWGNFPNILTGCMQDGDIVELFRDLYMFVTNLDPHSPLLRFERLPHFKKVYA